MRSHLRYPAFEALFHRLIDRAAEAGLRVVVAVAPTKARIYPTDGSGIARPAPAVPSGSGFARAVEALCRERSVSFVDLAPGIAQRAGRAWRDERQLLWWRDDTHWNARGHETAARLIEEHLRAPNRP